MCNVAANTITYSVILEICCKVFINAVIYTWCHTSCAILKQLEHTEDKWHCKLKISNFSMDYRRKRMLRTDISIILLLCWSLWVTQCEKMWVKIFHFCSPHLLPHPLPEPKSLEKWSHSVHWRHETNRAPLFPFSESMQQRYKRLCLFQIDFKKLIYGHYSV